MQRQHRVHHAWSPRRPHAHLAVLHVLEALGDGLDTTVHVLDAVTLDEAILEEVVVDALVTVQPLLHLGRVGRHLLCAEFGPAVGERAAQGSVDQGVRHLDVVTKSDSLLLGLEKNDDLAA